MAVKGQTLFSAGSLQLTACRFQPTLLDFVYVNPHTCEQANWTKTSVFGNITSSFFKRVYIYIYRCV